MCVCVCVRNAVMAHVLLIYHHTSYGDAVRELDSGVGIILDTLRTLDVDKDTLVIFSSDNGGATYAGVNGNHSGLVIVVTMVTYRW